jgi:hypothetical protein
VSWTIQREKWSAEVPRKAPEATPTVVGRSTKSSTERSTKSNTMRRRNPMSSQYRGVCWHKHSRKWVSQIRRENTVKCLGYFDSEDDAGRAYDDAIREYYSGVQKPQGWRSYNLEEGEWGVALLGRRIRADRIDAVGCGFIVMGRVYGHHAAHRVEGALKPHFIRYDDGVVQWVNIIRSSHIKLLSVESVPYSFSSEEEAEEEEEEAEEAEAEEEEEEEEEEASTSVVFVFVFVFGFVVGRFRLRPRPRLCPRPKRRRRRRRRILRWSSSSSSSSSSSEEEEEEEEEDGEEHDLS